MDPARTSRLPFLFAVALIAAAIADPVVESIANTGIVGGNYADDNHTSVIPTLLGGLLLVLEIVAVRCLDLLRSSPNRSRIRFTDIARGIGTRSATHDLPYVLAMQLAVLYFMESTEQLVVGGTLLGGTAWLGGPILFSLAMHALVGAGSLFAIQRIVRAVASAFASLLCIAIDFILLARNLGEPGIPLGRRDELGCRRAQAPHVRQIGGRAPPLLQTA